MPKQQSSGIYGGDQQQSQQQEPNSVVIDLSSLGGLENGYYGDSDQTSTLPYRKINQNDTTLAEGYFNPWMRQGYLSPAVATTQSCTFDNTPAGVMGSGLVDSVNSILYVAERGPYLFSASSLDSLSFTLQENVTGATIKDMEKYILDGTTAIFYSYSRPSDTVTFNTTGHVVVGTNGYYNNGTAVTFSVTGGSLPTGVSANTTYYIVTANGSATFQISTSLGGSALIFSSNGSGTITMTGVAGLGGVGVYFGGSYHDGWLNGQTVNSGNLVNPVVLSNNENFMRQGNDGYMYIFDGNVVHRLDGTVLGGLAGTLTQQVYSVLPNWIITDAAVYRQLMYIAAKDNTTAAPTVATTQSNYNANCFVAVWDMTATATETRDIIAVPGIQSIQKLYVSPTGKLRAIAISASGLTKLMEYDGTEFKVLKTMGLGAAPQYPDALTTTDKLAVWTGTDGNIYGHGQVLDNGDEVLAKIGNFASQGPHPQANIAYAGVMLYSGATAYSGTVGYRQDRQGFTFSYFDGSNPVKIVRWYPFDKGSINSVNQNALAGNIYSGVHFLESSAANFYTGTRFIAQLSTVAFINVFFAAGTSSGSSTAATIRVLINGNSTPWGSFTVTYDDIAKGYKRLEINQPYVNTVQLKIEYPTGTVLSDAWDFHPYVAIVYYSPTNTRG